MCLLEKLSSPDILFTLPLDGTFCNNCFSYIGEGPHNMRFKNHDQCNKLAVDVVELETPITCPYCGQEITTIQYSCVDMPEQEIADRLMDVS